MIEPTNAQLQEAFTAHAEEDKAFQDEMREWKETIATKEDIKEVLEFMHQMSIGIGIFRFTWNNAAKIGSFLLLISALVLFIKGGLLAGLSYLLGK